MANDYERVTCVMWSAAHERAVPVTVYQRIGEIIIPEQPNFPMEQESAPNDTAGDYGHNCDFMGCGQEHVALRLLQIDKPQFEEIMRTLSESHGYAGEELVERAMDVYHEQMYGTTEKPADGTA